MRLDPRCRCAEEFQVVAAKSTEYARVKNLLNRGNHPTFIGRNQTLRWTRNGGAFIFSLDGEDVATALVNPATNCLMVLNVSPSHRSHGMGSAILRYLQCNFARVLESAVPFFERNGYTSRGKIKIGKRLKTQVMVKSTLLTLAGRVSKIYGELRTSSKAGHEAEADRP